MSKYQMFKMKAKILYHLAYLKITGRAIESPILPQPKYSIHKCGHYRYYGPVGCKSCIARENHGCDGWGKDEY